MSWLMACDCGYIGPPKVLAENDTTCIIGCPNCSDERVAKYDLEVADKLGITYLELEGREVKA